MIRPLPSSVRLIIIGIACVSGVICGPPHVSGAAPVQTCTSQNVRGFPISGIVCGGSTHALFCSAGAIYRCRSGALNQTNNCSLAQTCAVGCLTGPTTGTLSDFCFSGTPPLTASTNDTLGGNDVGFTVTLAAAHPTGSIVNLLVDRGDLMPGSYCGAPNLPAGTTSAKFALPTATVTSPTPVSIFTDISYVDASGTSRELVSVPAVVTLAPGGTEPPPPPIASFTLTPSTIGPDHYSFMDVVLSKMAPAQGVAIGVTSSNPSVASVIPNGQPTVLGGCTTGGGAATIHSAAAVPAPTTVVIGASSGAPGQAPLTRPLTVTSGCAPTTCLAAGAGKLGGTCGTLPDGCGGTIICGCDFGGQICGGSGTPGVCGTPPLLAVSGLSLTPSSVTGGSSSTGRVTLTMAAPAGGAAVFLSSSGAAANVPQSVVVPGGQTGASFTVTTSAVNTTTLVTISAALSGTAAAVLTVSAVNGCTPTTCAAQGKNCGTIANGCGGTLSCGSCTTPQTCGGAGIPNVCGGGTVSGAQLSVTATGRSGEFVSSSPAGLQVNVGATGSASFATGTSITLTASNDRDVIWTGGCSSGGEKTKSCTLTLNTTTSVTANVQ